MIGFHTLRGMKENARKGYLNGASAPFGYKRVKVLDANGNDKYKLDIAPKEAEIARTIFKLYLQGSKDRAMMGAKQIAMWLNKRAISRRNNHEWEKQHILKILSNPSYAGRYYFNKSDSKNKTIKPEDEWILIQIPAIIGNEFFLKIQEIMKKRDPMKSNPSLTTSPSLLTGLLRCGKCDASMTRESSGKRGEYFYYNCRNFLRKGKAHCEGQRISKNELEKQILTHLAEKVFSAESTKRMLMDFYST